MANTLTNLANMFRVGDLRKKILFTVLMIVVFRIGTEVSCPYIDYKTVNSLTNAASKGGILGYLNLFSGGGLTKVAIFGLGIMPYIIASMIVQLLTTVIPKFTAWRDEGVTGQAKLTQVTRYLTLVLALMQSTGLCYEFHSGNGGLLSSALQGQVLIATFNVPRVAMIVLTQVAGTAIVMWMGELINQRGVGQGASILIFTNVLATMPAGGEALWSESGWFTFALFMALTIVLVVAIVYIAQSYRRIPVQYPRRVVGRMEYAGQRTHIPLNVNPSGVAGLFYAFSFMYIPYMVSGMLPAHGIWKSLQTWISQNLAQPSSYWYMGIFAFLIFAFAYFSAEMTFQPDQQAENLRKQGGYVPGIRPGRWTEVHLRMVLYRIALPGAAFVTLIALIPSIAERAANIQNYPFAGLSLLIAVGVGFDTMRQINAQLMTRNYESFLSQ